MLETISSNVTNRGTTRTWVGGLGAVLAASGLVVIGDSAGALGGVVLFVCWFALPAVYSVGVATVLVGILAPGTPFSIWGVTTALGVGLILVEPAFARDDFRTLVLATIAGSGLLGGSAWAVAQATADLWQVASIVVAVGGFALYVLHRYERARFYRAGVTS